MKYLYNLVYSPDGSWYGEEELGNFDSLDKAKRAAINYERKHAHEIPYHDDHCHKPQFEITATPDEGLDEIKYYRQLWSNKRERWYKQDYKEDFECTVVYRGVTVNVYCDDYGQCYYIKWRNKLGSISSEAGDGWDPDYMNVVHWCIDNMLDRIAENSAFEPYYGTMLTYINPEHTKAELTHRLESVQIYDKEQGDFIDEDDLLAKAKIDIENFCNSPEYLKAEEERLKAIEAGDTGKMYFSDLMKKMESEE